MGLPAAKQGDRIVAVDLHLILPPATPPVPPVLVPHPYSGPLTAGLSQSVFIDGLPAAVVGSTATATPPHVPIGGTFVVPPTNQGRIVTGSTTVRIEGRAAARAGDTALTCNDPVPQATGSVVVGTSTVYIGG